LLREAFKHCLLYHGVDSLDAISSLRFSSILILVWQSDVLLVVILTFVDGLQIHRVIGRFKAVVRELGLPTK